MMLQKTNPCSLFNNILNTVISVKLDRTNYSCGGLRWFFHFAATISLAMFSAQSHVHQSSLAF
ncbi:hypothetical protein PanWU01x14_134190 [Parasponia andersonii]|uniref:Uncharacterized protein n=1 Tax=Parasponia andersonii TaxID=3476 RepID=A0A2P5CPN5_PARAD|nr:hypothetical protein PanWU01x14_134190 [Parasponia andersonii]